MDPRDSPILLQQIFDLAQNLPGPLQAQIDAWLKGGDMPTDPQIMAIINQVLVNNGNQALPVAAAANTASTDPSQQAAADPSQGGAAGAVRSGISTGNPNVIAQGGGISSEMDNGIGGGGTGGAAATAAAAQQVRNATGNLITPTNTPNTGGGGGAIDPTSAIGSTLYNRAQQGNDDQAVQLLMIQTMEELGLDPFSGTPAVKNIMSTLLPYLQMEMQYGGLGETGKGAPGDRGREFAELFKHQITTPGTFGQIRQFGNDLAGRAKGILGGDDMQDPEKQGLFNDLIGLETAGGNVVENSAIQNRLVKDRAHYNLANAKDPKVDDFLNWLYADKARKSHPAYSALGGLLGR
jgi:hypothetical protein